MAWRGICSSPLICSSTLAGRKRVWGWKDGRTLARDTKKWTEEVGTNLAAKVIAGEYEVAVDDQKKELREYKKKLKAQEAQIKSVSLTIVPAESPSKSKGIFLTPLDIQEDRQNFAILSFF